LIEQGRTILVRISLTFQLRAAANRLQM
jgi:hypothetical protein